MYRLLSCLFVFGIVAFWPSTAQAQPSPFPQQRVYTGTLSTTDGSAYNLYANPNWYPNQTWPYGYRLTNVVIEPYFDDSDPYGYGRGRRGGAPIQRTAAARLGGRPVQQPVGFQGQRAFGTQQFRGGSIQRTVAARPGGGPVQQPVGFQGQRAFGTQQFRGAPVQQQFSR